MASFLKVTSIGGSLVALIALVIVLVKSLIALVGTIMFAVKALIILAFVALFLAVGVALLRSWQRKQKGKGNE